MNNIKMSYEVFHIENSSEQRNIYTDLIHKYVSQEISHLNSGTINFIDDKKNYIDFLNNNKYFKPIVTMKVGWVGVWASNYNAWKSLLDSDYDCAMLFEDDCIVFPNSASNIYNYIKELPEDWDFFSPFVHSNQYHIYNDSYNIGSDNVCKSYQDWSLACYIVSKNGAKKALEYVKEQGFDEPVDYFVFNENTNRFNTYTLKPDANKYVELSGVPTTMQDIETRINLNGSI